MTMKHNKPYIRNPWLGTAVSVPGHSLLSPAVLQLSIFFLAEIQLEFSIFRALEAYIESRNVVAVIPQYAGSWNVFWLHWGARRALKHKFLFLIP